jgi:hypothetical protein
MISNLTFPNWQRILKKSDEQPKTITDVGYVLYLWLSVSLFRFACSYTRNHGKSIPPSLVISNLE